MKKSMWIMAFFAVIVLMQGCATKNYGRQGSVTSFEESTFNCREIDLELAKVDGFIQNVDTESQFDGRSVLSFLGDFGIGNVIEKDSALKSASDRSTKLRAIRAQRCGATAAQAPNTPLASDIATRGSSHNYGEQSASVERLARQAGCEPTESAALIAKSPGVETYQASCKGGQQALFKCEMRQCRMMN